MGDRSIELKLPECGMGITEGTIAKWHKDAGAPISEGEILAEIEVAKAIVEVTSPVTGVLEMIVLGEGATGEVNTTIAVLREKTPA
jgi:pyruvate/2-oxoglutarate dehydrogenase complex dihydrolipoamide acyltransferase (E2) component